MNAPKGAPNGAPKSALRRWWPVLRRILLGAFFIAVAVLLFRYARGVEWGEVADAMLAYKAVTIASVVALALISHLIYAGFDLLARAYVRHKLGPVRTLAIAAVCYAFNVNLGALVGGVAFRYRLYSRFGLRAGTVAQVYGFAVVTNWSGYVLLLGAVLTPRLVAMPAEWEMGAMASQALGAVLLLAAAAYLAVCVFLPGRRWTVRGYRVRLPRPCTAVLQFTVSSANWALMAFIVYLLLHREVDYPTVLGTLLLAAIAGAMTHIPAGLGVLEAVFVLMLSDRVPEHRIIAAMLAYRAAYYLLPLLLTLVMYPMLEAGATRRAQRASDAA